MPQKTLTAFDLEGFSGTDHYYRHSIARDFLFSGGVKYLADQAGAYWLIDEIALANAFNRRVRAEQFQVWTLERSKTGSSAALRCGDGNGNVVFAQTITTTDFPLDSVKLYFENCVLTLPSER